MDSCAKAALLGLALVLLGAGGAHGCAGGSSDAAGADVGRAFDGSGRRDAAADTAGVTPDGGGDGADAADGAGLDASDRRDARDGGPDGPVRDASDGGAVADGGDAPADGRRFDGEGVDTGADVPCVCSAGPCCDGCRFRPAGTVCREAEVEERGCPWGLGCGSDVGVRTCSGTSTKPSTTSGGATRRGR